MRKPIKILVLCAVLCALTAALCACVQNNDEKEVETGRPVIAVSIVPQQSFVEAVCKDMAQVVVMIPPGSSPETNEPKPQEMELFSKADIYFSIGVPAEDANILPSVSVNTKLVKLHDEAAEVYPELTMEGGRDPHIWLSPKRVIIMIQAIAREMSGLDPENKDIYEKNAEAYIQELKTLDEEIKTALDGVKTRKFIVFHPAFAYLADDYDLQMYALEENGREATIDRLSEMTDLAKEEDIHVIFYQAEVDSRQSEAFAEEIGGKTIQLAPLAPNYIENLSEMAAVMAEAMK